MTGGDDATKVLDISRRFSATGNYVDCDAYDVPSSDRYPEGVKYSLQYGSTDGELHFRYDNFPDHPDAPRHHKHVGDNAIEGVEFDGVLPLYNRFKDEVIQNGEHWP